MTSPTHFPSEMGRGNRIPLGGLGEKKRKAENTAPTPSKTEGRRAFCRRAAKITIGRRQMTAALPTAPFSPAAYLRRGEHLASQACARVQLCAGPKICLRGSDPGLRRQRIIPSAVSQEVVETLERPCRGEDIKMDFF